MVAWPITELVFYSQYTQYCDVPASTEVVKLNPWVLADGIMNLFLLIIIVTLIFLFCWLFCCAFAIDLCCRSECVEFLGELSKLIALKITIISKSVYYRFFSILISFIMGAIGIFVSLWSFQHCQTPFPGIAVTATVLRIFGIFITFAMMFNVFDQCNE